MRGTTQGQSGRRILVSTADAVVVNLYEGGTWVAAKAGGMNGVSSGACNLYACTTGVNSKRAMAIDLEFRNPGDWEQDVVDYYTGLIAFRKAHPALRMTDAAEVEAKITSLPGLDFNVVGCHIAAGANGEENEIIAIFNPRRSETTVTLPEGEWSICINAQDAGTASLGTAAGEVTVEAISAMVLVKGDWEDPSLAQEAEAKDPGMLPVILGAVAAFVVGNLLIARSRKKQNKKED